MCYFSGAILPWWPAAWHLQVGGLNPSSTLSVTCLHVPSVLWGLPPTVQRRGDRLIGISTCPAVCGCPVSTVASWVAPTACLILCIYYVDCKASIPGRWVAQRGGLTLPSSQVMSSNAASAPSAWRVSALPGSLISLISLRLVKDVLIWVNRWLLIVCVIDREGLPFERPRGYPGWALLFWDRLCLHIAADLIV